MTKTETKKLLKLCENLFYAKRASNTKREQYCYDKLDTYCQQFNIDPSDAMSQAKSFLKKNSIAANMNSVI